MRRAETQQVHPESDMGPNTAQVSRPLGRSSNLAIRAMIFTVILFLALLFFTANVVFSQDHTTRRELHQPTVVLRALRRPSVPNSAGLPPLNITWENLLMLKPLDRMPYIRMIREGEGALEPNETLQHGLVGLDDSGDSYWKPQGPPPDDMNMVNELRRGGGFNLRLSDSLQLNRNIPDERHRQCRQLTYDVELLIEASVIIVFYNEPFSTLMRSVHSILNLSPPALLREIILVDDGSDMPWIKSDGTGELENYVHMLPKVRLIRLPTRKGIVGARMAGIRATKAPIFVILDSHIEVQPGWLEPLIQRIQEDKIRVVMPQIDVLDSETLEPQSGGIGCTLGFLWKMIEHGFDPSKKSTAERRNAGPIDFVSSPLMAGGLFAANTDFFLNEIGGYDEQFEYWGTENVELSFRLWQCGGRLECAPCSRVFHIFRKGGTGYSSPGYATTKNKMRTMTIWMDQYADLAWRVIGKPNLDFGDYLENRRWRQERGCKSFQWFLENINPESTVQKIPQDVPFLGPLVNYHSGLCIDHMGHTSPASSTLQLNSCHAGQNQDFMYFRSVKHIMPVLNDECCLSTESRAGQTEWCYEKHSEWDIEVRDSEEDEDETLFLRSGESCLTVNDQSVLEFRVCDTKDITQIWKWVRYNPPTVWTPPPRA